MTAPGAPHDSQPITRDGKLDLNIMWRQIYAIQVRIRERFYGKEERQKK